jgi:hypothetical protein
MSDDITNAPDVAAAGDAGDVQIRDTPNDAGLIPADEVRGLKSALERQKAENAELKRLAQRAKVVDELLEGGDPAELKAKLAQLKRQEELEEERQKQEAELRSRFERERAETEAAYNQRINLLTETLKETARSQTINSIGQQAGLSASTTAEAAMFQSFVEQHVEFEYLPVMRGETVVGYTSEVKRIIGPDGKDLGYVDDPAAPGEVKKADVRDFIRKIQQGGYGPALQSMVAAYNRSSGAGVVGGSGRGGDIIMSRDELANLGKMSPAELAAIARGERRVNVR